MSLETLETAPQVADFTPLSEYTSQTPGSFFGGKAVLHLYAPASILKIPSEQFSAQHDFQRLSSTAPSAVEGQMHLSGIDVWVTSRQVLLWASEVGAGLKIEYPSITVTAQDGEDVLLEVNLSDGDTADEDIQFVQLRILAREVLHHAGAAQAQAGEDGAANGTTAAGQNEASTALFKAISDCQELNPDPPQAGDEDGGEGGFDPTAPGATGWITSENMGDFMDENGEFRMPEGMTVIGGEEDEQVEGLGEGAGRTRTAAERDTEDGAEEEGKWQRTG